jgi:hypothetical protein
VSLSKVQRQETRWRDGGGLARILAKGTLALLSCVTHTSQVASHTQHSASAGLWRLSACPTSPWLPSTSSQSQTLSLPVMKPGSTIIPPSLRSLKKPDPYPAQPHRKPPPPRRHRHDHAQGQAAPPQRAGRGAECRVGGCLEGK